MPGFFSSLTKEPHRREEKPSIAEYILITLLVTVAAIIVLSTYSQMA